ncbi:hypothetical protein BRADI_2g27000v3 [Brachypodium distachyon]|uniref:Uncharacterized protein n=1 Tax=Brachypodium distachyon TaxID=15368 RepID=I1HJZ4_BRADI|nr:hypothetical protein BRADI_2g27000v3 [Brachypodium distachyon]
MGQATSSPDNYEHRQRAIEEELAAERRSKDLWRDQLRKPRGKDLPLLETYRQVTFQDACSSDALLSQLSALDASTPSCVYAKHVTKHEAKLTNGRFSVDADSPSRHIAEIFTDHELDNLISDCYNSKGREMPVFDRDERRYHFEFVYFENKWSNGVYRLVGSGEEYERFMVDNNVVCDFGELGSKMIMQMFAFRSPKLLPKGKGFHGHPDGALGMVILFSESNDKLDEDKDQQDKCLYEVPDDDFMTVNEMLEHYPVAPEGYMLECAE